MKEELEKLKAAVDEKNDREVVSFDNNDKDPLLSLNVIPDGPEMCYYHLGFFAVALDAPVHVLLIEYRNRSYASVQLVRAGYHAAQSERIQFEAVI